VIDAIRQREGRTAVRVTVTSILVDDQDKALEFYTKSLGFTEKTNVPVGDAKWLTVVPADAPDGTEILLEPDWNPMIQLDGQPAGKAWKRTLYQAGIPYTALTSDDLEKECAELKSRGVKFTMEPTKTDFGAQAVFDDTCGNLIMLTQVD
jgi:catechol 2,3-dioxygenase-like lactoylglutathione lyase family enzyme